MTNDKIQHYMHISLRVLLPLIRQQLPNLTPHQYAALVLGEQILRQNNDAGINRARAAFFSSLQKTTTP